MPNKMEQVMYLPAGCAEPFSGFTFVPNLWKTRAKCGGFSKTYMAVEKPLD